MRSRPLDVRPDRQDYRARGNGHVHMTVIVGLDVSRPILVESANDFSRRQIQMLLQHLFQIFFDQWGLALLKNAAISFALSTFSK
jgi:hypothetical protein